MPYQLFVSLQAPAFSMWELYFIHYQTLKYNQMKLLFAALCVIASISGSYLSLTAPSITQLLIGVVFILLSIICLLLLIIKDGRQEIDFWKSMKGFIFVAVMLLLGSCSSIRKTCPSNDPNFFFKQQSVKPHYFRH
jgi:drug/metabolite transporter (DMT)-like permease